MRLKRLNAPGSRPFTIIPVPILVVLLLFSSCNFKGIGGKNLKQTPAPVSSESPGISDALSLSEEIMKTKTGIRTLENGGESLILRLWLLEHAQGSIDLQYYSFARDATGVAVSSYLVSAADRGVKIRLLLDDAATRMRSHEISLLDSHENIEVRIYNAGLLLGRLDQRLAKLAKNSNRLLRRMHNKTFTVDGRYCLTGGRNISNEYFDYNRRFNFRDRDVLIIGKAVADVQSSFEKFWNDELTVTYAELAGRRNKKEKYKEPSRFDKLHEDAGKSLSPAMIDRIKTVPGDMEKTSSTNPIVWTGNVSFISDVPGKNEDKASREGGICNDSMMALLKLAKTSIDIQSPYFITTEESRLLLREMTQRGVKIRLLTNSLASIDNIEAFSGYQQDRQAILDAGVELYEFRPDPEIRYKLMIPEIQSGISYKPVYGLHSKSIIIDGITAVIGSYNFDPRSANLNTECIAVFRSAEVSRNLARYFENEFLPENAWRTTKDRNYDKEAGLKKRMKARLRRVIPKRLL
ncbi:MAG TPA: phospholipase D family protein [Bacteroidia bacterium]|jgi:phosphatidylserine/phosphatidylglycerophosphate/cardiolipin synthase-like enzyme